MRKIKDNIRREVEAYIATGTSLDAAVEQVRLNRLGRLDTLVLDLLVTLQSTGRTEH